MKFRPLFSIVFAIATLLFSKNTNAASDTTSFDGKWSVTMSAENYDNPSNNMSLAYAYHFAMNVKNGQLHGSSWR
jgi:hypothetical protein